MKIYLALVAVTAAVIIGIAAGHLWSSHQVSRLEYEAYTAKSAADAAEAKANEHEQTAAAYRAKTEYLEDQLAGIQAIARKQDEELETLNNSVGDARRNVDRSRSIRSISASADELCRKLAELGHGCR
jgi:hypothetical protein